MISFRSMLLLYQNAKDLAMPAILMTMKKNHSGFHQQKNVQKNLPTFNKLIFTVKSSCGYLNPTIHKQCWRDGVNENKDINHLYL